MATQDQPPPFPRPLKLPRGQKQQRTPTVPKAGWMEEDELTAFQYRRGTYPRPDGQGTTASVLLGKVGDTWIGSDDDRHVFTVAGSRAGKTSTNLKPNLLLWPSSVVVIDPKGELARDTAVTRAGMGQDVFILDPFEQVKGDAASYRVGFNPLDELKQASDADKVDDAALLAEALIYSDRSGDHWTLSAKNVVRGFALFGLLKSEAASLPLIRDLITLPMGDGKTEGQTLLKTFRHMMDTGEALGGAVARTGASMVGKPSDERGSIFSTAIEQTAFLDSIPMREHLQGSDRLKTLRQLKRKPTSIYLVLPASRIPTHARWLRVILTLALAALEREPMRLPAPVLFMLEEFPQLGYMRQIEAAAGLFAGYGVKLWTIVQDLSQLKSLYKESWETFIGNAGTFQAFANTDPTTIEYISRSLGTLPVREIQATRNTATSTIGGAAGSTESVHTAPLLAPFEVAIHASRESGNQILKFAGEPPAYIHRLTHQEVKSLAPLR